MNRAVVMATCAALLAAAVPIAHSQEANQKDKYVSKEEYEKLKAEHEKLKQKLEAIEARLQQAPAVPAQTNAPASDTEALKNKIQQLEKKLAEQQTETEESLTQLDKDLKNIVHKTQAAIPGNTRMLLTGYGAGTFTAARGGYGPAQPLSEITGPPRNGKSFFTADFDPIFLWELNDRVLFESEFAVGIHSTAGTDFELEYAQVTYLVNDHMTFGVGKFLNPANYFVERLHPAWINKLPDRPLAVFDGLLPEAVVGLELRGSVPVRRTMFEYAFFAGNSPSLDTQPVGDIHAGILNLDDNQFQFHHLATGGRVGFFPIAQLELGYGFEISSIGPSGSGVSGLLQSADLNYVQDWPWLNGTVDLKAQWVWSNLDPYTIDPTTGLTPLPAGLSNHRNGGYVQLAYRPSKKLGRMVKNFEPVVRYDALNQKHTPFGFDDRRWTVGLNYWLGATTVVKAAYEFDRQNGAGQSGDAFLLQFALGF